MAMHAIVQWTGKPRQGNGAALAELATHISARLEKTEGFTGFARMVRPNARQFQWLMAFENGATLKRFMEGQHNDWFQRAGDFADMEAAVLSRRPTRYRVPGSAKPVGAMRLSMRISKDANEGKLLNGLTALIRSLRAFDSFVGIDWLVDPDFGTMQLLTYWQDPMVFQQYLEANANQMAEFLTSVADRVMNPEAFLIIDEIDVAHLDGEGE